MKKVTLGSLVNAVVETAGVSKQNANSIVNLFTNAWTVDRIGFLKAIDTGIPLKKSSSKKRTTAKKVSAKKATKKTTVGKKAVEPAIVEKTTIIKEKSPKKLKKKLSKQQDNSTEA